MRLLLDTSTFIWSVVSPERVSRTAIAALLGENTVREISVLSLSEVAIKQATGKLRFPKTDVQVGIEDLKLRILPYTANHAYEFFGLPRRHADPFDRMIIAQALSENIPIITSDDKFRLYQNLKVIW